MRATQIIKTIMEQVGIGNAALGKRIGVKHDAIYQRLQQKNISINAMGEMLAAMDYKIVVVPASRRLKEDEFEVTVEQKATKPKVDLDALLGITKEEA